MLDFEALFGEVLMDKKCNRQHFTSLVPPKSSKYNKVNLGYTDVSKSVSYY